MNNGNTLDFMSPSERQNLIDAGRDPFRGVDARERLRDRVKEEMRENHHQAPEPPEEPPYCDRCGGYHAHNAKCPE